MTPQQASSILAEYLDALTFGKEMLKCPFQKNEYLISGGYFRGALRADSEIFPAVLDALNAKAARSETVTQSIQTAGQGTHIYLGNDTDVALKTLFVDKLPYIGEGNLSFFEFYVTHFETKKKDIKPEYHHFIEELRAMNGKVLAIMMAAERDRSRFFSPTAPALAESISGLETVSEPFHPHP